MSNLGKIDKLSEDFTLKNSGVTTKEKRLIYKYFFEEGYKAAYLEACELIKELEVGIKILNSTVKDEKYLNSVAEQKLAKIKEWKAEK